MLTWNGIDGGIEEFSGAHRLILVCWTIALALAGGLGATAWGGASVLTGVPSGLASGLVGAGIAWLLRIGARRTLVP